jgi:transposase
MARCKRGSGNYRRLKLRKARLEARSARRRREQLHKYTTALQRRYAAIQVHAPKDIKRDTESGRGNAREWGAEVRFKAMFNRRILDFAPAAAIAQLAYKFKEAGGSFERIEIEQPPTKVGAAVVAVAKAERKLKRTIKHARRNEVHHPAR